MKPLRNLQPAEPSCSYLHTGVDHSQPQKRSQYSKEEWERQKELVFKYYVKEKRSLREIMAKFAAANFIAKRERTWKKKIKLWGFEKNIPESSKKLMLQKKKKRALEGKDTTFTWGFIDVPQKRLEQIADSTGISIPQADTPEKMHYHTPKSISTPITDCSIPTHEVCVDLMAKQANKCLEFITVEQIHASGERYTENTFLLETRNHRHQMGLQWLILSGCFENTNDRCRYLIDARNFAIDLNEAVHKMPHFVHQKQEISSGEGPEYYLMNGDTSSITQEGNALLECVRQSKICPLMFGLDDISSQWKCNWRSMDMKSALHLNHFALHIFGDLQKPFSNMAISYLLIYFRTAPYLEDCKLIRIAFGVDKDPKVQECMNCQPAFMALDYIDCNSAMKIHIPLAHTGNERRCKDEHEYNKLFQAKEGVVCSSMVSLARSYQGWSHLRACCQKDFGPCCFGDDNEEWDPDGSDEQDEPFQPFPPDQEVYLCSFPHTCIVPEKEEEDEEDF